MKRRYAWLLGTVFPLVLVAVATGGWVVYQNSYDLREERVTVTGGARPLNGVLARPDHGDGPFGLVVFVHGDGPVDATHDTFYRPLWEAFAQAGYASLSWDKPGVDGAPGDWLDQSMDDRADETAAAIAWAGRQPGIDPRRIGLWGASQAGWVMPKVARRVPDLSFVIAVSPAVNWMQQGRYNLLAELADEHADRQRVDAELARRERTTDQLEKGASFDEYRTALGGDVRGMTADRWRFVRKNWTSDATADIAALRVPVLLVLAGRDRNVDTADTEAGYRRLLTAPGQLTVQKYPDATHGLVHPFMDDSPVRAFVTAVAAPRSVYADGFLAAQRDYLRNRQPGGVR